MKIAILSQEANLYSSRRLKMAGKEKGHDIQVINYLRCHAKITLGKPKIIYKGKPLEKLDAIIPRIAPGLTRYGTTIVQQFEMMGVYSVNGWQAIAQSRDKLRCLQILASKGIDVPITVFTHSTEDVDDLIKSVGGPPLLVKLLESTQGMGVVLADSYAAAKSVIQAFRELNAHILIQEYICEAQGGDIRCFVVGDRVVAAMKRQGNGGEFRANLHLGGKAETVELSEAETNIAIHAAQVMGLAMAGVDLLRSNRGPLVLEINSSPGLQGIEETTGIDVAGSIIDEVIAATYSLRSNSIVHRS